MERTAGGLQQFPASNQIDAVVAVPSIRRTAPHGHELARSQLTKVIRQQALRCLESLSQFRDRTVAADEFLQEPPADGVHETQKSRWIGTPRRAAPLASWPQAYARGTYDQTVLMDLDPISKGSRRGERPPRRMGSPAFRRSGSPASGEGSHTGCGRVALSTSRAQNGSMNGVRHRHHTWGIDE